MNAKKIPVWVGLLLLTIIIPIAYASGFFRQPKPDDLGELSRGRYKLLSMIAGCEMDNNCMLTTLNEVVKNDPHPVYEQYLSRLNKQKDHIIYEQVHCNTPAIRAYRRDLTICLRAVLKDIDPKKGIDFQAKEKYAQPLQQCLKTRMENLGKAGNLYAQAELMYNALKNKDMAAFERWYNAISLQRTKLEFSTYRECETPVKMFDLL